VESLTLTEPEPPMLRRLERKVRETGASAMVLRAPAEDLPFEDDSFDTVVSTLVQCGVSDQQRALREIRRVLRPGGRLVFLEHVRSDDERLARTQRRMNGLNRFLVGCECTRPTLDSIGAAGFDVVRVDHVELPKTPKFVRPSIVGVATAPLPAPQRDPELASS
jgi:SAM-dependent methyltransferase